MRELYALDDERLLLVASDRISTFDVVLPTEIPDKGRVLTGLSAFWFAQTRDDRPEPPARAARRRALDRVPASRDAADRVRRARLPLRLRLEGLPRDRRGLRPRLPDRPGRVGSSCRSRSSRRRRRRRPGHDENIDRAAAVALVGEARFDEAERISLALYRFVVGLRARRAGSSSPTRSSSSASTREGRLVLGDEAFTPDSSRFWPADEYRAGRRRSRPSTSSSCATTASSSAGTRRTRPRAARRRRRRHAGALRRGVRAPDRDRLRRLPRRPGGGARVRATVLVRPKPGILDPQGQAVESSLRHLGFSVDEARVGRARRRRARPTIATRRARSSSGCASSCSRTR